MAAELVRPLLTMPIRADPLPHPTAQHPRWRLVVFDKRWPWRATVGEALRDAVLARHARHDRDDKVTYLNAYAMVQRDPPERRWVPLR